MEMEASPPVVVKKLWNMLASKAIVNSLILHHHYAAFTCRSNDANLSFISPREYEFSCSNSPAYTNFYINKRNKHHHHLHNHFAKSTSTYRYDDVSTVNAVQNLSNEISVEASPLVTLPGFGKSPIGKQLRITDSPFPLKDEGDSLVDKAAEEFIKNFYKDLKFQKNMAAIESPYYNMWGR
ncbi:Avr9/Cf-9 rapidly elicited protein [Quillaja saponaria]|uniref:Avr9/Cf-9 rapidly elicited protein n=1 Tax=Quillaja saponaria TaxID=32244 RepID=A0AAD7Q2S5_QUISA|nr:Avr9/Cf-9 rapidly elicited protein [Quillaja saponaria]